MSSYQQFLKDYKDNQIYETIAAQKALDYYNRLHANQHHKFRLGIVVDGTNYFKCHYDFEIIAPRDAYSIYIEVKRDRLMESTGNVFVEFANPNGSPSGISKSQSHFYIITNLNADAYHLISTKWIKYVITLLSKSGRLVVRRNPGGGKGYIIPKAILIDESSIQL